MSDKQFMQVVYGIAEHLQDTYGEICTVDGNLNVSEIDARLLDAQARMTFENGEVITITIKPE